MTEDNQLFEQLSNLRNSKTIILGIGNTLKADDGVGPLICSKLDKKIRAEVIDAGTVPENYIQPIIKKTPQNLLIVDAIDFCDSPGKIQLFKPHQLDSLIVSTHTLSPRVFVDMMTQEIDMKVYFIGIQPFQTQIGCSLSAAVDKAAQQLISTLTKIFGPVG